MSEAQPTSVPEEVLAARQALHIVDGTEPDVQEQQDIAEVPEQPLRRHELAAWLGVPLGTVVREVRRLQPEFPQLFTQDDEEALVCQPQVAAIIRGRMTQSATDDTGNSLAGKPLEVGPGVDTNWEGDRHARTQRKAIENFTNFGEEMKSGETVDAQTFAKLIDILGAESAVDVLYRFRKEYQNIPMPIVRSFLADYLGDFIVRPGKIDWNNVGECLPYFNDAKLQSTLGNVIKRDCLRTYNLKKRENPDDDDFNVIADYIAEVSAKVEPLSDKNLNQVVKSVADYYENVFFLDMPANLVDSLKKGRTFPDLNQRINIYETTQEKRILIADDPGLGKSASAIFAKEAVGSKLAVILTPSAVLEDGAWQTYLSSTISDNGKQLGYFKQGQEPRVLVAESAEALVGISEDDYDYILVSHERLDRDGYAEALQRVGFDMLIVDEAHGFKNIIEGKRAAKLVELSQTLSHDQHLALLTATPAPNKVIDIAMSLRLLYPDKFRDHSDADLVQSIIEGDILEIRSMLLPKMQCKSLADTREISQSKEEIAWIKLMGAPKLAYEVMLDEWELEPKEKLRYLRQILMNPGILDGTPTVDSAKIELFNGKFDELFLTKKKILMFVNGFVKNVIDGEHTILDGLELPEGVQVEVIHGEVRSKAKRREILDRFRNSREPMLLIVSGQTVSMGVDLSIADAVFMYNEPWTKDEKTQQYGRGLRPPRKGKLYMLNGIYEGTIEEGIHHYINAKGRAINKLLHGVPITEAEKALVASAEKSDEEGLEVNAELAHYYYSAIDRMNKMFGMVKEIGEDEFRKFLGGENHRYAKEYANAYRDLTTRSYQANSSRLTGTIINRLEEEKAEVKVREKQVILDIGSGPEMLRRHVPERLAKSVISLDVNPRHFDEGTGPRAVGVMAHLPIASGSVDYANMSLVLHYSAWQPKKGNYERLEVLGELNRVLKVGGSAIIAMPYSLDVRDSSLFAKTLSRLGFSVVESYSGRVSAGDHFVSQVLTIRKSQDVALGDPKVFIATGGNKDTMHESLRFVRRETRLRDQRRIASSYTFEDSSRVLSAELNGADEAVRSEEDAILKEMTALKDATETKSIADIPAEEILKRGFSRIYNGSKYLLFKHLQAGGGAVTYRG